MKVELLVTLKGTTTWRRGAVFDDAVSPIPGDILREVDNPQVIRVIPKSPFAVTPRTGVNSFEETAFEWGKLPEINDCNDDAVEIKREVKLDSPENYDVDSIIGFDPKPLQGIDGVMAATADMAKSDIPLKPNYIIELNVLIDQSSLKRAAAILGAPYQRLAMWRAKRKEPTKEEIQKIHEEYAKVSG